MFESWLYAYQTKARIPGDTVIAAMNPVFDHLSHCKKFSFLEVIQVIQGHYQVKHCICCYCCIPWIPIFRLICIKPQLKHFHFWRSFRSLEVVRGHQKVKDSICCYYCIPWVSSFRLICIKAMVEIYSICVGHQRSLEVI